VTKHKYILQISQEILVEEPGWTELHGRPRLRLEDNIKQYFKETESDGVDWIQWAQDKDL
jgi:hypothetical protein